MALIVQKFGGTSVANPKCLQRVAEWVLDVKNKGNDVVVIVSAMGDTTDDLIALAHQITPEPDDREMDVLMATGEQVAMALLTMALHARGGRGRFPDRTPGGDSHRFHPPQGQDYGH